MKHLFVPYELAIKLKEKGFDELTLGYFTEDGRFNFKELLQGILSLETKAPLYQQVIDWFREKHNLYIVIHQNGDTDDEYVFRIYKTKYPHMTVGRGSSSIEYYIEYNKAIEEALKLIP